jgi:hypothetical protein
MVWLKSVLPPAGGKLLRLPLEAAPSETGTVAARPYTTEPGRFLARGEALQPGELAWVSHFTTCPDAAGFRRKAALAALAADSRQHRRRPPAVREPGDPAQPALFPARDTTEGAP